MSRYLVEASKKGGFLSHTNKGSNYLMSKEKLSKMLLQPVSRGMVCKVG